MDNSSSNPTSSNGNDGRKPRLRKKTARGQPSPLHPDNQTKSDASNSTVPMTQKRSSAGNLKDPAGSSRSSQLRPRQPSQDHSSKPTPQPLSPNLISSPSPTSTSAPHSSVNQPTRGRPLPSIPNAVPVSQPSNIAAVGDEITAESSQQTFENIPWSPSNAEFGHSDTASTSNPSQQPPNKPVRRQRSLIRPERQPPKLNLENRKESGKPGWWTLTSWALTFWAPPILLATVGGMSDKAVQQAWREKMALVVLIFCACLLLAFLTFGLTKVVCSREDRRVFMINEVKALTVSSAPHSFSLRGHIYDLKPYLTEHMNFRAFQVLTPADREAFLRLVGIDITMMFPPDGSSCRGVASGQFRLTCQSPDFPKVPYCHDELKSMPILDRLRVGEVRYPWEWLAESKDHLVYNGKVLNMSLYLSRNNSFLAPDMDRVVRQNIGRDATMAFLARPEGRAAATCLADLYAVGFIDRNTVGCIASDILLYVSLIVILGVVMARFFLALAFGWFMSWQLGKLTESRKRYQMRRTSSWFFGEKIPKIDEAKTTEGGSEATLPPSTPSGSPDRSVDPPDELRSIYTILLVTCYSEGEQSIRTTLDSLATTDYPDRHKLLFVVADGLIKGSGNDKSTPDIIISMMELDDLHPSAESYVAIADGSKRHNKAKIFTGYYNCEGHRVRMITIVKCGTEAEAQQAKPGNRGKRDSQIVLMDFYSKLIMNDRLSPFQYDLYRKIFRLTGVSPHRFEIVLMVDADTKVMPDSLSRMVACMARDPQVMGLCGETRIANKTASWVTRIQVFEYYISHHLSKAFESIFGGVTCLPGCFCMYRIKAPKRDGYWVPIIANPEIVEQYSENVVDTLHKKNLLLLGEDRYLTTLMLRTFPRRKMLFVPKAMCKTFVPDTLRILLSQRRRWINSTVHNLFELVLVRQLCGTFCFSMQFVVFLELIGTLTLPAAITFTITLLIFTMLNAFKGEPIEWIPLALLAAILGLPAVLILLTTRKMVYIYWMFVYLLSLPVWNFLLPVYAFWHFDDFSWGQTRKVEGAKAADDHGKKEGEFNVRDIVHKTLVEWEMETANLGWDPEMEMYLQKDQMRMRDQDLKGKVKAR